MLLAAFAAAVMATGIAPLDGTAWVLKSVAGRPVVSGAVATLQFSAGRVSGSDGCNGYSGTYGATLGELHVSPDLAATRQACPGLVDEQASAYVAALTGAQRYRVQGERLELLSSTGKVLATLVAQSLALAGSSWHATGINNGRQAVVSVLADSTVTLSFGPEGDASGSGGCNHYAGQYETRGSGISFAKFAVTAMACADPALMEQEQNYFRALAMASTLRMDGDRLELRTADGALAVSFVRATGG
jgi:heat shock protein HslJ